MRALKSRWTQGKEEGKPRGINAVVKEVKNKQSLQICIALFGRKD